jgi:GT2 family glycosyltransferase
VFVIDNASFDGSAEMVRQNFPEVHLIENEKNVGFARATNTALRRAGGRYLLLLNSDTLMPSSALKSLCCELDARPDAIVCGPFLCNSDASPQLSWARFPGPGSELKGNLDRSQAPYPISDFADSKKRAHMKPFSVDWVGGACFLIRAEAIRRVGLLDESFFFYGEETDLCHRLRQEFGHDGGEILLIPSVCVMHIGGQSSRSAPGVARRHLFYSSLRLYRKLYGFSPTAGAAMGLAAARYLLSCVRRRLKGDRDRFSL